MSIPSPRRVMNRPLILLSALVSLTFSSYAFSQQSIFIHPSPVTVVAGQNFSPSVSPDGRQMVFVSDRDGHRDLFLKSLNQPGSRTPALTRSSSVDTSPAWSPDGKKIAFISNRDDPDGDVFLLDLSLPEQERTPKRLTQIDTADSSPAWSPDGKSLYYSSRAKTGETNNIWRIDLKTGNRTRITEKGGLMPAVSPDGRYLAFVTQTPDPNGDITLMRLSDGRTDRWTTGREADASPAWDPDGQRIYFSRCADDTNLDGRLSFDDNPSIWTGRFSAETFSQKEDGIGPIKQSVKQDKLMSDRGKYRPRFRQLTSGDTYDIFPYVTKDRLYYASYSHTRGPSGNPATNILSLPRTGMFPVYHDQAPVLLRLDRQDKISPRFKIMAWRNLLYDSPSLPDPAVTASLYYKIGRAFKSLGNKRQALEVFDRVASGFPEARLYQGLSRIETIVIRTQLRALSASAARHAVFTKGIRELNLLAVSYRDNSVVSGTARLRSGDLYVVIKNSEKALAVYDGVARDFKAERALSAEALFSKAGIYAGLGNQDRLMTLYLSVIRQYPDLPRWREKAVQAILEISQTAGSLEERTERLYRVANQYADIPALPATALVKAGEIYYNNQENLRAKQAFNRVVAHFPMDKKAVRAAKFHLARIYFEEEDFDQSFRIYKELEVDPASAYQSKREFISRLLTKGEREFRSGEARLSIKTFRKIIGYDFTIIEAHRGLVQAYASLKETDKAMGYYRKEIERLRKAGPSSSQYASFLACAHYGLGLALTYSKPPPLDRALNHLPKVLTLNGTVSYYFQTAGWVYEQKFQATNDNAYLEKAADAYQTAISLSKRQGLTRNLADLRLNLGNAFYLIQNFGGAYAQYQRRFQDRGPLDRGKKNRGREALYYQRFGETAFKLGKTKEAIGHFSQAISLLRQIGPAGDQGRIAELISRTALAYQDKGKYDKAAEYFSHALEYYRKLGDRRRMAVTLRNIATNLYFSTGKKKTGKGSAALLKALNQYFETIRLMEAQDTQPAKKKKTGNALIQIDIEQGLDAESSRSAMGFSRPEEEKLIFNYIGKIFGDFREYGKAVEYFKKKLSLTPADLPVEGNVPVLLERAIIENQIGNYLYLSGKYDASLEFFQKSLQQSLRLKNSFGVATNAVNMGRLCSETILTGKEFREDTLENVMDLLDSSMIFLRKDEKYTLNGVMARLKNLAGILAFSRSQGWVERTQAPRPHEALLLLKASLKRIDARSSLLKRARRDFQEGLDLLRTIPGKGPEKTKERLQPILLHNLRTVSSILAPTDLKRKAGDQPLLSPDLRWQLTFLSASLTDSDDKEMEVLGRARDELLPLRDKAFSRSEREMAAELFKRLAWLFMKSGKTEEGFLAAEQGREWALAKERLKATGDASSSSARPADMKLLRRAQSVLGKNEALVRVFPYQDTLLEWVLTKDSLQGTLLPWPKSSITVGLNDLRSAVFHPPYRRLYLIPDSVTAATRWEPQKVMYLVSLRHLVRSHAQRNLRISSIVLAGSGDPFLPGDVFRNTAVLEGNQLNKKNFLQGMKENGIVAVTSPVVLMTRNPVLSYLDLSSTGNVGERLSMEELYSMAGRGYLASLANVRAGESNDTEGFSSPASFFAYLTLADAFSRAGYPYVLINTAPFDRERDARLTANFFQDLRLHPPTDSLLMAEDAAHLTLPERENFKLFGYGGMEKGQRRAFAKKNLKKTISMGRASFKQGDWISAERHLEHALSLLDALGINQYKDILYKQLVAAAKGQRDYAKAVRYQRYYLEQVLKQKKPARIANAYHYLGYLYYKAEDFPLAEKNLLTAIAIYRKNDLKDKMAEAYSRLGITQARALDYHEAVNSLGISRAISSETGQSLNEGRQLNWIGSILLLRLNDYSRATETFQKALGTLTPLQSWADILESLLGLARACERQGDFKKASDFLRRVMDLIEERHLDTKWAECQLEFANVAWFQGDYQKAFVLLSRALERAEHAKNKKMQSLIQGSMGLLYWTLNDYSRALNHLARSLELAREEKSDSDAASALNNTGLVYRDRKEYGKALQYFQQATTMDTKMKSRWGLGYDHRNIGMTRLRMGDIKEAEKEIGLAMKWSAQIHNRVNLVKAMLEKGNIALKREKFQEALEVFGKTRTLADKINVREVLWRAVQGEARARAGLGESSRSIERYKRGVKIVENMRSGIKVEELRNGFTDNKGTIYEELIIQLLNLGKAREAFNYSERARSRSFIDLLGNQKISLKNSVDQGEYEHLRDLKRAIEEGENSLKRQEDAEKRASIERKLQGQRNSYRDALIALKLRNPQLSNFVTVDPMRLKDVQARLNPGTTLLEYMVAKKEIVIWVVKKSGLQVRRVPVGKKELTALIREFRNRIQSLAPLKEASTRLYQILVRPIEGELNGSRVIGIIPHGSLHYLSFAALRNKEGYFLERYPLFYLPSASVLQFTLQEKKRVIPKKIKVLAIGNPDLGDFNYDLPLAEMEANSMRWDFPDIDVLTRKRARESWVVAHIGDYDIIHIASHGEFDPINPLFSSLKLSRDIKSDGNLEVNEVFGLNIKADLVTLSACQTGLGKVTGGDEIIGLNRAFFYAGARSLLSSLWRISDVSTAILIKHFYRNYGHMSKAEALRKAQLLVKRYYPHPAYWSGFSLTGNDQ